MKSWSPTPSMASQASSSRSLYNAEQSIAAQVERLKDWPAAMERLRRRQGHPLGRAEARDPPRR